MGRSEESKRVAVLLGAAQNPQDGHHAPHWLSPGSTRLHLCIQGWSGGKVRRPNREHKCTVTHDGSAALAEAQTSSKSEANNSEMRERGSGQDLAPLYQYNTNADRLAACKACSSIWIASYRKQWRPRNGGEEKECAWEKEGPRDGRGRRTPNKEERKKQKVGRWETVSNTDTTYTPEVQRKHARRAHPTQVHLWVCQPTRPPDQTTSHRADSHASERYKIFSSFL